MNRRAALKSLGLSKTALVVTTILGAVPVMRIAFGQEQTQLEEVVVTAERTRAEALQDVPMSVEAITNTQMQMQGIQSGEDLNAMVPNLVVGSESSNGIDSTVAIRGIPEVGLYVDGIWQPDIGFREAGIIEMQRVEVLRGPQGTLFGRNTNGGAINYITVEPAEKFGVHGAVESGDFGRRFFDASVDVPVSETVRTKWTGAVHDQGGWVKSLANGKMYGGLDNRMIRGDVLWEPTSNFSLRTTANLSEISGTPAMEERFTNLPSTAAISNIAAYNVAMMNPDYGPYTFWTASTEWSSRFNNGDQWTALNNSWKYPGGRVGKWENDETEPLDSEKYDTRQYTMTATWNLNSHKTFTNLLSYLQQTSRHFDNDPAAPVYQWNQLRMYRYNYWSEEAHLTGDAFNSKVDYLLGFYYLHTRERTRTYSWPYAEFFLPANNDPILEGGNNPVLDSHLIDFIHAWGVANAGTAMGMMLDPATGQTIAQDLAGWRPRLSLQGQQPSSPTDYRNMLNDDLNEDYSIFANTTWHVTSRLDVQAGLRAAWNKGVNKVEMPEGGYRTYLLPMLGGGTGYGPGPLFDGGAVEMSENPYPSNVIFTPLAALSYHWNGNLMTYMRYAQGYTTGNVSYNTTLERDIVLEPEKVHDYELGLRSDWFNRRLRANLTLYRMLWDGKRISSSFTVGDSFAVVTTSGGQSRAQGFEAEISAVPIPNLQIQLSFARLDTRWLKSGVENIPPDTMWALAPKRTYHLAGQYDFDLPNQARLTLRADYGYQSAYERDSDPDRQLLTPEPGYGLLNARIEYAPSDDRWNLQLYGTNLGDVAHIDAGTGSFYLFGVDAAYLGPPRMVGLRLTFNY